MGLLFINFFLKNIIESVAQNCLLVIHFTHFSIGLMVSNQTDLAAYLSKLINLIITLEFYLSMLG